MKQVTGIICRYCGNAAHLVRECSSGFKQQYIWYCPMCRAQMPARTWDHSPRGIMATGELRLERKKLYDMITEYKSSGDTLRQVLRWLGIRTGEELRYLEDMDEAQVAKAVEALGKVRRGTRPWMKR